MFKTVICAAALMLCTSVSAQNATEKRSDRKIIEISKIVKLSPEQEAAIRNAYDAYNLTVDSALYVEQNPVKASRMKQDFLQGDDGRTEYRAAQQVYPGNVGS